jgi:adenylate cyclase
MALEIERKFLLRHDGWRSQVTGSVHYRQAYLNQETDCSVRVRVSGDQAWLNLKGVTIGSARLEFEYEIPVSDAHDMLNQLSKTPVVEKQRYFVRQGSNTWEIDVFEGENAGLVVAEIELDSADEYFDRPDWLGAEVTRDVRYYNTHLARHPYSRWPCNGALAGNESADGVTTQARPEGQ